MRKRYFWMVLGLIGISILMNTWYAQSLFLIGAIWRVTPEDRLINYSV